MGINLGAIYSGDSMNAGWVKSQTGGSITRKIVDVVEVSFTDEDTGAKERKAAVLFENCEKKLTLNVTNKNILIEAFTDDTDKWIGKTITVKTHRTTYMGKPMDGIIVEIPSFSGATAAPVKVLGEAGAAKMLTALGDKKLDVAMLRAALAGKGYADAVVKEPKDWPAAWVPKIKEWMDNPGAGAVQEETFDPDSIPF